LAEAVGLQRRMNTVDLKYHCDFDSHTLPPECSQHSMPRNKKPRLRKDTEARRRARLEIGMPPPARRIADKRTKPPKHKKKILPTDEV
jgi:hypothetical protein